MTDTLITHVVGLSMGGGIAQYLGVEHRDRVRSLVLMASSPAGPSSADNALPLDGVGHQQPPQLWDLAVASILDHTAPRGTP